MSFINDFKNAITENHIAGKYFEGIVVDNKDPKQKNRVRVILNGITDKIPKKYWKFLPWYAIRYPIKKSPNSQSYIPKLKSRVIVYFEEEDIMNGIVIGAFASIPPEG